MLLNVLDKGYVKYIDHMGSDETFIEAARMSTGKGFLGWGNDEQAGDEKLLAYLWNNRHTTPFEMGVLTIEVKAPIFVIREWMRHRTQSYNEMSARYIEIPCEDYIPDVDRIMAGANTATTNKQAQGNGNEMTEHQAQLAKALMEDAYSIADCAYRYCIALGVPKELARIVMPVGRYSVMRVSTDILNWFKFLNLRMASNAQWEIRQYANAVAEIIQMHYPRTYQLFIEEQNK